MAKDKKRKTSNEQQEQNPETIERNRLKSLAHTNNIISTTPTKKGVDFNPLVPSKTLIKHHANDIIKKHQKKNRYLLSFPGLLAPLSGGHIGQLTNLSSKNPLLYLDFPQGRMKLFGTIVYPKNRYLTLQLSRAAKSVKCEDCFDTMIVFSDAWWIGKKEDNPDEVRLEFPKELYEKKHYEVDFQGGSGATAKSAMKYADIKKKVIKPAEESLPESPVDSMETESPVDFMDTESPERQTNQVDMTGITPTRHSERTAGKNFNFAEGSSGDDFVASVSGDENEDASKSSESSLDHDPDITKTEVQTQDPESIQQSKLTTELNARSAALPTSTTKESSRGSLVQATLSSLFKKAEEKKASGGKTKKAASKDSHEKKQLGSSNSKKKHTKNQAVSQAAELRKEENISGGRKAGARDKKKKQKINAIEDEDDIEEFSSASEDLEDSDEDWQS